MISSQSQSSLEAIMFNGCDERHLCKKGHPLSSQLGGQSFRYLKHFLHQSLKPRGGSKTILTNHYNCLHRGSADSLLIWFTVPTNISLPLQRSCLVRRIQEVLQLVLQGAWNPVAQSRDKKTGWEAGAAGTEPPCTGATSNSCSAIPPGACRSQEARWWRRTTDQRLQPAAHTDSGSQTEENSQPLQENCIWDLPLTQRPSLGTTAAELSSQLNLASTRRKRQSSVHSCQNTEVVRGLDTTNTRLMTLESRLFMRFFNCNFKNIHQRLKQGTSHSKWELFI